MQGCVTRPGGRQTPGTHAEPLKHAHRLRSRARNLSTAAKPTSRTAFFIEPEKGELVVSLRPGQPTELGFRCTLGDIWQARALHTRRKLSLMARFRRLLYPAVAGGGAHAPSGSSRPRPTQSLYATESTGLCCNQ
eukprot:9334772-Pyramimonas_sp.AAC.4